MYYELTWVAAVFLGVGAVALGVPLVRLVVRALRDREIARGARGTRRRQDPSIGPS